MHKKLEKFSGILEKDLENKIDQIVAAGTINPTEVKTVTDAVCLMLKVNEYKQWLENSTDRDMSYRRGRDSMTGRYVSRDTYHDVRAPHVPYDQGYSGHSINDRMIDNLERMMDQATSDYERQKIQEAISMLGGTSR